MPPQMKKIRSCRFLARGPWVRAIGWLLFLFSTLTYAELPPPLIHALAAAHVPADNVGVYWRTIDSPIEAHTHQPDKAFNPASLMKLVTTYVALNTLGPHYRFKTDFYTHGTLQRGILNGDLIIQGHGDPKMNLENFWLALRQLRAQGLKDIRGQVVFDASAFGNALNNSPALDGQNAQTYNTAPHALLLNLKSMTLTLSPQPQLGVVAINVDPPLTPIHITNHLRLSTAACPKENPALVPRIVDSGHRVHLYFEGAWSAACPPQTQYYSVLNPLAYNIALFKYLWHELGGTLHGSTIEGTTPTTATLLFSALSPPLSQIIYDINKFSNNVMAKSVFLTLGQQSPASVPASVKAIHLFLERQQLRMPHLKIDNGAGLSRQEALSAGELGRLLEHAFHSPFMSEFMASLPILGIDGTLARRTTDGALIGQAHLKTGSLDAVRAIAGYLRNAKSQWCVVVLIINDPAASATRAIQEDLLNWIYNNS